MTWVCSDATLQRAYDTAKMCCDPEWAHHPQRDRGFALLTEKADLEEAIKTLRSGIAGLNREGRERLLTAFEQVNANFSMLFTHLFGGGEANLVMVESDDPLEAGLEILCQPPGKKLSTLSLLLKWLAGSRRWLQLSFGGQRLVTRSK